MCDQEHIKRLRFGIVGLGFGASVHAPALLAFPDVEVVGLAARSAERAQIAANALGIAKGCGSVSQLLDLGLDAITLAVPPDQVIPAVKLALARKIPVLCEKPLGTDAYSATEIAKKANKITNAVNFIFAELDTFIRLKKIIESGSLGKVRHANLLWLTESWAHRSQVWSWKTDANQHGGVISLLGSHVFYLAEWLFGDAISVFAKLDASATSVFKPTGASSAEDFVSCQFRHSSGIFLNCVMGNANPGITIHRWTIIFEKGSVVVENNTSDYMHFKLNVLQSGVAPEYFSEIFSERDGRILPFSRIARRFVDSVKRGCSMQPDFNTGARVQLLDNSVRSSAASGKEIRIR